MGQSCFFIGHRDAPDRIAEQLREAVERHIVQYHVTDFVVGTYGRFDQLAAQAVADAKKRHPDVSLFLLLPYHPTERTVSIPLGGDGTFYPPGMERVPKRLAISRANRYMIDHSDFLIFYAGHPGSNTWNYMLYAQKQKHRGVLYIENLWQA